MTSVPAVTAEWNCARCGTTNRKLIPSTTTETRDRCTHCRRWHVITVGLTPVRWDARLAD
jgi:DNA-directed RNA polymerase subunit RPC12/RpoP